MDQLNLDLSGKTALVCGASQGIGAASARLLAGHGASVILLARDSARLEKLSATLPRGSASVRHGTIACDVRERRVVETAIRRLIQDRGAVEILVCNTGGPKSGPIAEASEEEFLDAFQNHVLVNSLLCRLCMPGMKDRGYGRIINIISTSVKMPIPNLGVSNTVRAAVASWAKTLSLEVASFGITVNNVLPGYTETTRLQALLEANAQKSGRTKDEVADEWRRAVPMGRFANVNEIAAAVAFFASPAAAYITGTSLACDGGRTGAL